MLSEPNPAVPYASGTGNVAGGVFNPNPHWSLFYWHLRFGGSEGSKWIDLGYGQAANKEDDEICERIRFLDFDRCKAHGIPAEWQL